MMLAPCILGLKDWKETPKVGAQSDNLEGIASLICNSNGLSESNPGGRCMTVVDVHDSRWGEEDVDLRTRFPLHAVPRVCRPRDCTRYHVQIDD